MKRLVAGMERHQIALYLLAILVGGVVGMLAGSGTAGAAGHLVNPVLGLLLYVTFLGIPLRRALSTLRDLRFLATVAMVNFVAVPLVVWLLTRPIAGDEVLLVGVLFVLLAPCIDYVIVFTGLAGGAADRLLAAAPLLMAAQMLLLPVFLWAFLGSEVLGGFDAGPFVEALGVLIVLPLCAAAATQAIPGRAGDAVREVMAGLMVPLMMLTLALVVASQIAGVNRQLSWLVQVVPVYVAFVVVMTALGWLAGRPGGGTPGALDVPARRAVVFTGVTRNSLVVLPLVLALPAGYELAPLVVVTQTLVELVAMVVLVRTVPLMIPERPTHPPVPAGHG
ncbi:arsenic resistance protein [Corynebacterium sp. AOP12-C2-36]|uniref:arsenic resistance protein n=1 Tax=Corynebacterium sp. AOP12-C2-36 TaxID=3457723 RepID=UPI004033CB2F